MHKEKFLKKLGKMLYENGIIGQYDTDHPNCPNCGSKMNFYGHSVDEKGNVTDFKLGDGYWKCTSCQFKCTEDEVFPYVDN